MNLTAGTILQKGNYSLHHALGQGLRSLTFKATQVHHNRAVAIKTFSQLQLEANFAPLQQPFMERARRFGQCQHPGLVRVLDVFEESGLPFVAMDYVAGQSLAAMVKASAPLPEAQAIQYIRQVGSALNALHSQGLVHGEVKPTNLIRPHGSSVVVLVDMGLTDRGSKLPSLAEAGVAMGSYAAIEQYASQEKLTPATDVYALAATLYFLLTGHDPTPASIRQQLPLLPPRQLQPQISPSIEAAILSGMELHPSSRPQTIAAWFTLLLNHSASPPVQSAPHYTRPPIDASDRNNLANGNLANGNLANGNGAVRGNMPPPIQQTFVQPTNQSTRVVAPADVPSPSSSVKPTIAPRSRLPKVLVMTAAIAAAIGLGMGLALRLGSATGIGPKIFNTQQSFPPIDGWLNPTPDSSPTAATPTAPAVRRDLEAAPAPATKPRSRPTAPKVAPEALPTPAIPVSPLPSPVKQPGTALPERIPDVAPTDNPKPAPSPNPPAQPVPVTSNKSKG